jgi:hypothetical protein
MIAVLGIRLLRRGEPLMLSTAMVRKDVVKREHTTVPTSAQIED